MKCKRVLENLSAYADGELGSKLRRQIGMHLAVCERCAAELSRLEQVTDAARASLRRIVSETAPPDGLRERVMRATEPMRPHRPILIPVRTLAGAAAIIALMSGFLGSVVQESRSRSEREAFLRKIVEQGRELDRARGDSQAARTQLMIAEARRSAMGDQWRVASAVPKESDVVTEGRSPGAGSWPPALSSLQMPGARSLLKNGLF